MSCVINKKGKYDSFILPNGEESILFEQLLNIIGNDKEALKIYNQTQTLDFQLTKYRYELDSNGEPVVKNKYPGNIQAIEVLFQEPTAPINFKHKSAGNIKEGVSEVFESNPELANAVYSKILTNSDISAENLLSLLLKDNLIEKQCS